MRCERDVGGGEAARQGESRGRDGGAGGDSPPPFLRRTAPATPLTPEPRAPSVFGSRVVEGVKIEGTRLFDKLSVEAQEDLLEALTEVTFTSGQTIIEQGQLNDTFYVIKSGVARVQQVVANVAPGRSFGGSSRNLLGSQRSLLAAGGSSRDLSGGLSPRTSPRMKDIAQLQAGETFGERCAAP